MSLTKVNISWKQSPCYTCACRSHYWLVEKMMKILFFEADFWAQYWKGKSHCLAVTFSEIHFSHCSWVLPSANVEIMAGDEQTRRTRMAMNHQTKGWSRMNPELSGSNRRLSLCIFLLLVLLPIGRGKDLAQARTITAQYIFLIWAIVAEPWPIGRQWQEGGLSPAAGVGWFQMLCRGSILR